MAISANTYTKLFPTDAQYHSVVPALRTAGLYCPCLLFPKPTDGEETHICHKENRVKLPTNRYRKLTKIFQNIFTHTSESSKL